MISTRDRRVEDLNLPYEETIDTPKYREAYADLMRTSKKTRESGLTYLGFLSRMRKRNVDRRKREFERRSINVDRDWPQKATEWLREQLSKG